MSGNVLTAKNALAVGLGIGGLVAANYVWDNFKEDNVCGMAMAREGISFSSALRMAECMADQKDGTGTSGKVSDLTLEYEKITTDNLVLGFGEVDMGVNVTAKFVYNGNRIHDFPVIDDVKLFYNRNNDQPTVISAMPCFNAGSYKKDVDAVANAASFNNAEDETKMKAEIYPTKNGSGIEKVVINAGALEFCMPHVKQTLENENLWNNNDYRNLGTFGTRERAAYVHMMAELTTLAALAQGCPEEQLEMKKVEGRLKNLFMGEVIATVVEKGGNANMVREAYDANKVQVKIDPPSLRQDKYEQQFHDTREGYMNGTRFPAGMKVENMEIGSFVKTSCNLAGAAPQLRS